MIELNFVEEIEKIVARDHRYHRDAYLFLREALDFTQRKILKENKNVVRHVSGKELLEGIREYAISQYGPMSKTVFETWGISRCADFGELVFNMIDQGLLSKTDQDRREDFHDGYEFDEAFCRPYRPAKFSASTSRQK